MDQWCDPDHFNPWGEKKKPNPNVPPLPAQKMLKELYSVNENDPSYMNHEQA